MEIAKAVAEFREKRHNFELCTRKTYALIEELLKGRQIPFAQLEERTKSVQGFEEKIARPGKSYSDPLNEITDLCGVRVILRRTSEVDQVVELLKAEFIVDERNSVYKAKQLNVDQFGYDSINLVVSAKSARGSLQEWAKVANFKVEVQVRTILQHAWATISHAYDYKVDADVPQELRRPLFRLSALLELADQELDRFAADIQATIENYRSSLKAGNKTIELNVDSLRAFVETSPILKYWQAYLRKIADRSSAGMGDLSRDLRLASFCGVTTLNQIEELLNDAKSWGKQFFDEYIREISRVIKVPPDKVMIVDSAPITLLLVAAHVDRFTPEILKKEFGWGNTFVLDVARRVHSPEERT